MIIDVHTHISYKDYFSDYFIDGIRENIVGQIEKKNGVKISLSIVSRLINGTLSDHDCQKLIEQMNDANIDKSVLLPIDLFYKDNTAKEIEMLDRIHEEYYKVYLKNKDRFIIFAGIDPRRREKGTELFRKCIEEYHVSGLKLYPPCGFRMNCKELDPYYELCGQNELPVLCHCGVSLDSMYYDKEFSNSIHDVANRYKNVRFILGHAAYLDISEMIPLAEKYDNVYLEVSGFQKDLNNMELLKKKSEEIFSRVPSKILFGTDWPMFNTVGTQCSWVDFFKDILNVNKAELDMLFYKNAQSIFKIH